MHTDWKQGRRFQIFISCRVGSTSLLWKQAGFRYFLQLRKVNTRFFISAASLSVRLSVLAINMLIAVASPGDRNAIQKEAERIVTYKDVKIEIQRMWNVKAKMIPVIMGATGTISESFRQYLRNVDRKHDVKEVQKTVILGTAHIRRKVLM